MYTHMQVYIYICMIYTHMQVYIYMCMYMYMYIYHQLANGSRGLLWLRLHHY